MEQQEIISQLNPIFKEVLDNEDINITPNSSANEIDEWDSFTHIQLIIAIEKHFKVQFTSSEIRNWKNVGEMADCILAKINI